MPILTVHDLSSAKNIFSKLNCYESKEVGGGLSACLLINIPYIAHAYLKYPIKYSIIF